MSKPLLILYATTSGNAQICADRIAEAARQHGYEPRIWDVDGFDIQHLANEPLVLFSVSTYGDGEPPGAADHFWARMQSLPGDSLPSLTFAVYALGDSSYSDFCGFGRKLDEELGAKGATRLAVRWDSDLDYEAGLASWCEGVLAALAQTEGIPAGS